MNIIEFHDVSVSYSNLPILKSIFLNIERESRIAILGHSGCGKTTLLRLLAGFTVPDQGKIIIDGELVAENSRNLKEPQHRNLGMVFQDLALWPHMTVEGNLAFPLKAHGISMKERKQRIDEVLGLVKMNKYRSAKPAELSGGQQQRVAIARALVLYPKILLMDEPLSSVDFELSIHLRKEIITLQKQMKFTLVYVTHNLEEAFDIANHIMVMKDGCVYKRGSVKEIQGYFETRLNIHNPL